MAKIDVLHDEHGYRLLVEFPGVAKRNVKVELTGRDLLMEGLLQEGRLPVQTAGNASFWRERCTRDRLSRTFTFSKDVDPASITAELNDGLLDVRVALNKAAAKQTVHVSFK